MEMAEESPKKNKAKYESYKLAFKMIKEAKERQCPLQAIAIEESILTDRLSSTLNVGTVKAKPFDTLGKVLRAWHPKKTNQKPNANAALFDRDMEDIYSRLDAWWGKRNALLHSIAKSPNGLEPEISADDFPNQAAAAVNEGLELVRFVDSWTKKKISQSKARMRHCGKTTVA